MAISHLTGELQYYEYAMLETQLEAHLVILYAKSDNI